MSIETEQLQQCVNNIIEKLENQQIPFSKRLEMLFDSIKIILKLFFPIKNLHNKNLYHNYKFREISTVATLIKHTNYFKNDNILNQFEKYLLGIENVHGVDCSLEGNHELKSMTIDYKKSFNLRKQGIGQIDRIYNKQSDSNYMKSSIVCSIFFKDEPTPLMTISCEESDLEILMDNYHNKYAKDYIDKSNNFTNKKRDSITIIGNDLLSLETGKVTFLNKELMKNTKVTGLLSDFQILKIEKFRIKKDETFLINNLNPTIPEPVDFDNPELWTPDNWAWYIEEYEIKQVYLSPIAS